MGFDPVAAYLAVLQARFGHLGAFCAGLHGSYLIAVRWHPQANSCARSVVLTTPLSAVGAVYAFQLQTQWQVALEACFPTVLSLLVQADTAALLVGAGPGTSVNGLLGVRPLVLPQGCMS